MSDERQSGGWWKASDGMWYPPETHPDYRPPPPPPTAPLPPPPTAAPLPPAPPPDGVRPQLVVSRDGPGTSSRLRGCGPWLLVGVALLAALVGVLAVSFAISAEDDEAGRAPAAPASLPAPGAGSEAAGAADEVDDVGPCQLEDPDTVLLEVVNNSSRQSSYVIDVNYLDAAGNRVGDESFFVSFVRSGETARQAHHVFDDSGGVDCSVAEVERFAAESPDDIAEVPCRVEGVGPLGNIRTEFIATNRSSGLSDYFFTAALVRDGVRVGAAIGSIENVPAGQSAPGDGFTTVSGPADGVECQTVHVQRTASG